MEAPPSPRLGMAVSGDAPNNGIGRNRSSRLSAAAGSVAAASRIAGAALAHPCGTDNRPNVCAWPIPADTAVPEPGPTAFGVV